MPKLFAERENESLEQVESATPKPGHARTAYWQAGMIFLFTIIGQILVFAGAVLVFSFILGSVQWGYIAFIFALAAYGNKIAIYFLTAKIIFFVFSAKYGVDFISNRSLILPKDKGLIVILFSIPYFLLSIPYFLNFSIDSLGSLVELIIKAGLVWFFLGRKLKQIKGIT